MEDKGFNQFNTWEHLEELRERQRDCEDYPVRIGLERNWERVKFDYIDFGFDREAQRVAFETPIDCLCYLIEAGVYPPPELLLVLHDCFNLYRSGEGQVGLEEVFFGPSIKGVGNRAAAWQKNYELLDLQLAFMSARHKGFTRIEAAEEYVKSKGLDIDPESLIRSYRRRLKKGLY